MSASSTPVARINTKLIRPAVIELRFGNKKKYEKTVNSYRTALGITKPFNPPKPPARYTRADSSFSCQVGMVPKGWKDQDMELRFVLVNKKKVGRNRTIVYWEVKETNLPTVVDTFKGLGYQVVDPLHPVATVPGVATEQTILRLSDSSATTTATSTAFIQPAVADGNTVGLVINPPYPRYVDDKSDGPGWAPTTGYGLLLLGAVLAVGLLLGWGLTRLAQRPSR